MGDVPAGSGNGLEVDRRSGQRAWPTDFSAAFGRVVLPEGTVAQGLRPKRLAGVDHAEGRRQVGKGKRNNWNQFFVYVFFVKCITA